MPGPGPGPGIFFCLLVKKNNSAEQWQKGRGSEEWSKTIFFQDCYVQVLSFKLTSNMISNVFSTHFKRVSTNF